MNWSRSKLRKMCKERYRVAMAVVRERRTALKMRCYSDRRLIVELSMLVGGLHGKT